MSTIAVTLRSFWTHGEGAESNLLFSLYSEKRGVAGGITARYFFIQNG